MTNEMKVRSLGLALLVSQKLQNIEDRPSATENAVGDGDAIVEAARGCLPSDRRVTQLDVLPGELFQLLNTSTLLDVLNRYYSP